MRASLIYKLITEPHTNSP